MVALAEHGNFHRAATTLQISQPALTKSIQTLEAALGVKLFDRQQGGVVLTDFGKLVVEYTKEMVATEGELLRRIGLLAGLETGAVKVALGPYPIVMSAYAATGKLIAKYPKLNVSLQAMNWRDVCRLVTEKKVDLGVAELTDAVLDESLQTELVGRHQARLLLPSRSSDPWTHVGSPLPIFFSFLGQPPVFRRAWQRRFRGRSGRPVTSTRSTVTSSRRSNSMFRCISHASLPAGTRSRSAHSGWWKSELQAGTLAVIPTPGLNIRASYGFIHLKNRALSPAASAFMQEVRDEENRCAEREQRLERRFLTEKREPAQTEGAGRKRVG